MKNYIYMTIGCILTMGPQFANPELTQVQCLFKYWYVYLIGISIVFLGILDNEFGKKSKKGNES